MKLLWATNLRVTSQLLSYILANQTTSLWTPSQLLVTQLASNHQATTQLPSYLQAISQLYHQYIHASSYLPCKLLISSQLPTLLITNFKLPKRSSNYLLTTQLRNYLPIFQPPNNFLATLQPPNKLPPPCVKITSQLPSFLIST